MFRRGEERAEEDRQEQRRHPIEAREVRMNEGSSSEVTVVGKGARLEGTIVSAGSLRIDGQVKGKISADGDVVLSPQSQVEADIQATNVTVAGRFKGNLVVRSRAELARGGRVDGNVRPVVHGGAGEPGPAATRGQQPARGHGRGRFG